MDGREVCADDNGFGVLVCEIYCPDTGSGADVEDFLLWAGIVVNINPLQSYKGKNYS